MVCQGAGMKKLKLYVETSVWNFFFADDAPEKRETTEIFFASLEQAHYEIFISEVVTREVNDALEAKKKLLFDLINIHSPIELAITEEAGELTEEYLRHHIVPQNKRDDALHIAIATAYEMDAVISWNYKHLVNLRKTELFNAVNLERGYTKRLAIVTPMEVIKDEGK